MNWTGNLAYVKPAKPGGRTNINLITASGNVYSFLATEVSQDPNGHADLKIFVTPSDASAVMAMKGSPRFIPSYSLKSTRNRPKKPRRSLRPNRSPGERKSRRSATQSGPSIRTPSGTITRSLLARRTRSMLRRSTMTIASRTSKRPRKKRLPCTRSKTASPASSSTRSKTAATRFRRSSTTAISGLARAS